MDNLEEKARNICQNIFYFDRTWDMESDLTKVKLDPINWKYQTEDEEWNFMLNRMEYLIDLVVYSQISGKNEYQKKAIQLIKSWIDDNPEITSEYHRTLDTGIRLLSWSFVQNATNVYDEQIKKSIQNQVDYLINNYRLKDDLSNWGLLQSVGVLSCKKQIDTTKISWWENKLQKQIELQITNDGWHWEHSIMYHNQILLGLCRLQEGDSSYDLLPIIDRLATSLYTSCKPNYCQVQQNDSDNTDVCGILAYAYMLTQNELYKFELIDKRLVYLCEKENIIVPKLNDVCALYPDSGLAVIRKNQIFLSVHNHPYGSSHSHLMWGHINFYNNSDILIDPGRYSYVDNDIRRNLKSIRSHNCAFNSNMYNEQILNSWDSRTNTYSVSTHMFCEDEIGAITTNYTTNNQLVVRDTILIGEQVLIFDVVPKEESDVIEANLILDPCVKILDNTLSNGYKVVSNFQDYHIENQYISKAYNQVESHSKIKLKTKSNKLVYYQGLLKDGYNLDLEYEDDNCICYRLSNTIEAYLIYLCPKEVHIGSKVKQIRNYSLYGKVVIVNTNTNKIYKVRI